MTTRPTTVNSEMHLGLLVPGTPSMPVRAELRYDVADPYAVQIGFHTGSAGAGDVVEWTFARQLLSDGVRARVGQGDVQVWPSPTEGESAIYLSLSSPSGRALFEVPLAGLVEFLTQTYAAVPTGCEADHVDLDAELALLLWAEPET